MNPNLYHLNTITACAVARAREKTREGQKDEARDWYRFIFQSGIVEVLKDGGWNVASLEKELKLLGEECHPLNHVAAKGDLARIADSLDILKKFVMRKPATHDVRSNGQAFKFN